MFDVLKIVCIGPVKSGKTRICKYLYNPKDESDSTYTPTIGTRILEFERQIDMDTVDVELWDCSGDRKFENCWLAMESNADGYMLVYNPDDKNSEKELKLLYTRFIKSSKTITAEQCLGVGYSTTGTRGMDDLLGSKFISVGPETMEAFDTQFTDYVQKLANIKAAKAPKMPGK